MLKLAETGDQAYYKYGARIGLGDIWQERGDLKTALKSYSDGLAIAERLAQSDPGNAGWQRDLSVANERLGDVFLAQGNLLAALERYQASLTRMVPIRDRDPSNTDLQRFTSVTLENWALLAARQITMRKADGCQSLAEKPSDLIIDHAA